MTKIPTSFFSRGSRLLAVASKLALAEASSRLKTWESEKEKLLLKVGHAQELVKTLSELKGASMKVGQLLSLDLGDYLPPEVTQILSKLHQDSTFLPFHEIAPLLQKELGAKFVDFKNISINPIAAASIGQVHSAYLDGKKVVLKVQYPGVADSIPSDLKLLKLLLKQASFVFLKEVKLDDFFNELEVVLKLEADYENELLMHLMYQKIWQGGPYIIPGPYADYCSKRLLVQEFIEGESLNSWLSRTPPRQERVQLAHTFMELYLKEFFHFGLVQTDPNPGNFLITPQGQLALLDFGAVKSYSPEFIRDYKKILQGAFEQDGTKLLQATFDMGFLDRRESPEALLLYQEMMNELVMPFRSSGSFDFGDKTYFEKSQRYSWELSKNLHYSPPPKDLIFLHRKLAGIFAIIKKLDVQVKLADYWSYVG
jgi:aarF domain-containing kinase